MSPPDGILSWNSLPVQSVAPADVSGYWLPGPTMPLGQFPRLCGVPLSRVQPIGSKSTGRILSSSSRSSRVSFQSDLVARRNGIDSSLGLLLPIAHEVSKVHFTRACLPATFRLQGLVTLLTVYSLRDRAGLISDRQRFWDSPCGAYSSRKVSLGFPKDGPVCR